jgi:hypothetical protein
MMAGVINRPVAAKGIIAFQDKENPETFEYFPSGARAVLGETLNSFEATYYGIGGTPQWVQAGSGIYLNLAGGIVSGQLRFDATEEQLEALKEEIGRVYEIDDPSLVPVRLFESSAQPVFAEGVANLGGNSSYTFPDSISVGEQFNFNIDSGNSLFAQLIASQRTTGSEGPDSPVLGMNIKGNLQLYGEPFEARIKADLSQVWEYVRDQVEVDVRFGWVNLGSDFDSIAQNLQKENIIEVEYIEGRADSEFGLQLLESTKMVFEAINAQITAGEGMFRFEPNPDPQEPKEKGSWLADLAPWSVGVNMSFIRNSFKQSITFDETVRFQGIFTLPVHSSVNLGVVCGADTKNMFYDMTLAENGCITTSKIEKLQERISREVQAKEEKIEEYEQRLLDGKIDLKTYEALVAVLNDRMLTERHQNDSRSVEDILAQVERQAQRIVYPRRAA